MHKTYFDVDTHTWVFKSACPSCLNIKVATFVDKIKMQMHHLTLAWLWCLYIYGPMACRPCKQWLLLLEEHELFNWPDLNVLWTTFDVPLKPRTPSVPQINQLHSKVVVKLNYLKFYWFCTENIIIDHTKYTMNIVNVYTMILV
jgi:hypothetical protein